MSCLSTLYPLFNIILIDKTWACLRQFERIPFKFEYKITKFTILNIAYIFSLSLGLKVPDSGHKTRISRNERKIFSF
jgi:hypothetical protein